jgi:hypothetical protein
MPTGKLVAECREPPIVFPRPRTILQGGRKGVKFLAYVRRQYSRMSGERQTESQEDGEPGCRLSTLLFREQPGGFVVGEVFDFGEDRGELGVVGVARRL